MRPISKSGGSLRGPLRRERAYVLRGCPPEQTPGQHRIDGGLGCDVIVAKDGSEDQFAVAQAATLSGKTAAMTLPGTVSS